MSNELGATSKFMKSKVFKLNPKNPDKRTVNLVAKAISSGGLAVFPTDTVYGLGTNAFNIESKMQIYKIKGRSFKKPLALLVASIKEVEKLVADITPEVSNMAVELWPGPLTLIFSPSPLGKIINNGQESLALRIPDHPIPLSVIKAAGVPMATTSANISDEPSAKSGSEAKKCLQGKVNIIIDGGRCPGGMESTIVDVRTFPWTILREGAISKHKLMPFLNETKK